MRMTEELSTALERAKVIVEARSAHIVRTTDITRSEREILVRTGWLQEIIRGWYMLVRPDVAKGDTAAWYANFWDFVRVYLEERFEHEYCLSAESSLDIHMDSPTIPKQVIVITKKGTGIQKLLHETSLMVYADEKHFPENITQKNNLNVMPLAYAMCRVSAAYFKNNAREAELALKSVRNPSEISRVLLKMNLKPSAARIIGAYEFFGNQAYADQIKNDLFMSGVKIKAQNPFKQKVAYLSSRKVKSAYGSRIKAMWNEVREIVIRNMPKEPGLPIDIETYMNHLEEIYEYDAYNSLSIEGYQVTTELINQVKSNHWNPDSNYDDNETKNALAARGYYDAFQAVKKCTRDILEGKEAVITLKNNLQKWYQQLFGPFVSAGVLTPDQLIGYRNDRVFIRNSRHAPPRKEIVLDAMESFFDCLENEESAAVRAVLGHYFFVYIHPYMDGNGRIARFLMNLMLASGGYPWTIVHVQNRNQYIDILEATHLEFDITDFSKFIAKEMKIKES